MTGGAPQDGLLLSNALDLLDLEGLLQRLSSDSSPALRPEYVL